MTKLPLLKKSLLVLSMLVLSGCATTSGNYNRSSHNPTQWVTDHRGRTRARIDSQGWITSTTGARAGQTIGRVNP